MASTGPATNEQEARSAWVSAYPFEPYNNGDGVLLACTGASARAALVGSAANVNSILITNMSSVWISVKWGDATVVATVNSLAVGPGTASLFSFTTQGAPLPTFIAGIAQSGSGNIQVTLGYGGN